MALSNLSDSMLRGVGATAIGVAVIRARETDHPNGLVNDPLAAALAAAARQGFVEKAGPDAWSKLEQTAEMFHDGRIVAVRFFDDQLQAAVESGMRQVVMVGAGLDTRAYRLPLPPDLRVFEVDLPDTFAFKEPVLNAQAVSPNCNRTVVPADLRENWSEALLAAGLRVGERTLWIDEGCLPYLSLGDRLAVLGQANMLSAPGSRLVTAVIQADATEPAYQALAELVPDGNNSRTDPPDPMIDWLNEHNWQTTVHLHGEFARACGRPPGGDPRSGYLIAESPVA